MDKRHQINNNQQSKIDPNSGNILDFAHSNGKRIFENTKRLLTYKQAAKYLGISEVYLRRLKAAGRIKTVPIGFGIRPGIRLDISDLDQWIEKRKF